MLFKNLSAALLTLLAALTVAPASGATHEEEDEEPSNPPVQIDHIDLNRGTMIAGDQLFRIDGQMRVVTTNGGQLKADALRPGMTVNIQASPITKPGMIPSIETIVVTAE